MSTAASQSTYHLDIQMGHDSLTDITSVVSCVGLVVTVALIVLSLKQYGDKRTLVPKVQALTSLADQLALVASISFLFACVLAGLTAWMPLRWQQLGNVDIQRAMTGFSANGLRRVIYELLLSLIAAIAVFFIRFAATRSNGASAVGEAPAGTGVTS